MTLSTKRTSRSIALALAIGLLLLLASGIPPAHAATLPPALQQENTLSQANNVQGEQATTAPRDCIDPLKAGHIAATLISLLPLPGWADAADAAAYGLNIALKHCPPELTAPDDIVIEQPNQGCFHDLRLPTPVDFSSFVEMDRAIIEEFLGDIDVVLTVAERAMLTEQLQEEYGRFDTYAYGSYSNIYGISLPINLTSLDLPYWDEIGSPEVYHYNSDVLIEMRFPGERISPYLIRVPVGNHSLVWEANTQIYTLDYVPVFIATSAYRAYKAAQAKATKRFAIDASKGALKKQIEQMLKEGNRFFVKQVAKEIAQNVATTAALAGGSAIYKLSPYYTPGNPVDDAITTDWQKLTIVDPNPPVIKGVQDRTMEATDPGGIHSVRKLNDLRAAITVTDDCDPDPTLTSYTPDFWPLSEIEQGQPVPSAEIRWRAEDNGAASAAGGVNVAEEIQKITVVDTEPPLILPPPPVMMYSQPGGVEVPLGNPQVFDVVDLRPTITYNATNTTQGAQWPIFQPGVHYVEWTATDQSQNTSEAVEQLVNIKAPDTNNTPTAFDQTGGNTIQAIADEPIKITVRGEDPDVDGEGMRDPIWFNIDRQPDHGFFIAPLYPYFVDDYRITARYSPEIAQNEGEEFALGLAQDPNALRDYIIQLCEDGINPNDLPKDFVSFYGGSQKYMAVDDEGYTYIYDQYYDRCTPGGSTIAPQTSPRISVWDQNGLFVGQQVRQEGGRPLRDVKFDIARGYIISTQSDGSTTGNSLVNISRIQPTNPDEPVVDIESYGLWNRVNNVYVGDENTARRPEYINATGAVWDDNLGILYVIGETNYRGMAAFQTAPCDNDPNGDPDACLNFIGTQVYSLPIIQSTKWDEFPGLGTDAMRLRNIRDIALDSHGNVYILANPDEGGTINRIYKFAAATENVDGSIKLGDFVGWMGKCTSGPNCNYVDDRSIGYSCTDATCIVEGDTGGDLPGQFNRPAALAMDRNDVLYVADSGNQRVQRFSPDGLFAGEARSQEGCDSDSCSGFVLGAFGSPGNIAVNASHFYILDIDEGLVHIFEASVIHSIDDSSAWVEYQSKNNYVGPDSFTFRATDGFHTDEGELIESAPATVALNVARNFRPPFAEDDGTSTNEDTPVAITLTGYDLDGDLDTLTYSISFPPQYGKISGTPPNVTYTPNPNFAGEDQFHFIVNDGRDNSEPGVVTVLVIPQNDTPVIEPDSSNLQAGLGHAVTLHADILDPDADDTVSATVNWGDGVVESSGDIALEEGMGKVSLTPLVDGVADLLAYHTYGAAGNYTINIEVEDSTGAKATAQVQVTVAAMADVALQRNGKPLVPNSSQQYSYELLVTNQPASDGQGVTANDVRVTEILTGNATFAAAIAPAGNCEVNAKEFTCNLGSLNINQEAKVTVQIELNDTAVGSVNELAAEATASTTDPLPENNLDRISVAVVPTGDFYVDTPRDGADANPGDGTCATAESECTVRAAIMEANALAGAQTIVLGDGVYVLEGEAAAATENAITEASGDLDITAPVSIVGIGAQKSILHANGIDRVIEIHAGSGTVNFENVTITGGDAGSNEGGGILNAGGEVHLHRVVVDGNRAVNGGGIMNSSGTMTIIESSIATNQAQSSGGGIFNQATLSLENVTLSANQADGGGGLLTAGGNATLLNVTIVGNSASNAGGGINSTGNAVRIKNTMLAGNDAPIGPNCAPELVSDGNNLLGTLQDCNVSGTTNTNVSASSPQIDVLTLNAAETYSHPLLAGSPAIGRATCQLTNDQTGAARPSEGGCDIGAYETDAMGSGVYIPVIGK